MKFTTITHGDLVALSGVWILFYFNTGDNIISSVLKYILVTVFLIIIFRDLIRPYRKSNG